MMMIIQFFFNAHVVFHDIFAVLLGYSCSVPMIYVKFSYDDHTVPV